MILSHRALVHLGMSTVLVGSVYLRFANPFYDRSSLAHSMSCITSIAGVMASFIIFLRGEGFRRWLSVANIL